MAAAHSGFLKPGLTACMLLLLGFGIVLPSRAEAAAVSSAFVVADLPLDATGKSGVAARDGARSAGQKQALLLVLQRLTAPQDWTRLPTPDDDTATGLVLDYEVESEHASAGRYIGRYTYRFDPDGVRQLLQSASIPFTELVSKKVVLIPLFQKDDGAKLWDDPNPWREAWNAAHGPAGLVPWIVPVGDIGDVQALDVPDAQHPSADKLSAMSQRYDGGDVVVAQAVEKDMPASADEQTPGTDTLQITVTRYGADGTDTETTSVSAPKADAGFYQAGVQAAERSLEDMWKKLSLAASAAAVPPSPSTNLVPVAGQASPMASSSGFLQAPGENSAPMPQVAAQTGSAIQQSIEIEAPLTGAADWVQLRSRIAQVSGVQAVIVQVLARDVVLAKIDLLADPNTLPLAFAQQDLALTPGSAGGPYFLHNADPSAVRLSSQQSLQPLPAEVLSSPNPSPQPAPQSTAPLPPLPVAPDSAASAGLAPGSGVLTPPAQQ